MSAQFNIKSANPVAVARMQQALGMPRFIATTLVSRGISNPADAIRFLNPTLERDWLDPYLIPGLDEVASTVERALRTNRHILVFGDFDLDGISATTVLTRGLRELGGTVTPFIPRRFDEGYGLSVEAFERALEMDPSIDLVITVDCGIACRDAVDTIRKRGVDLCITDHHEPADLVPRGFPLPIPSWTPTAPAPCWRAWALPASWSRSWADAWVSPTCGAATWTLPPWAPLPTSCPCGTKTAPWWPPASA